MAHHNQSRNPFVAPGQRSIADVIGRVALDSSLPKTIGQNWCWGLRTICRAAGKDPASVPAHPDFLRRLMKSAAPAAIGLTPAAWNNARSLANKALGWARITTVPGRYYQAPYTPQWAALWAKLPPKSTLAFQLSRFFHYLSATAITPADVTDGVLEAFHQALVEESLVRDPWAAYRGAAKSWNNAAERIEGWPTVRLTVPTKRKQVFSLAWIDLPPPLRAEIDAYFQRAARVDLDGDFARPQRPQTIETRRKQVLWLAAAIVNSGIPLHSLTSLDLLLAPQTVQRGLYFLLNRRAENKSFPALASLAQFLPALARRSHLSDTTVDELERYKRALQVKQSGMAERHKKTLRKFDDPAAVHALVRLPDRIRREIEDSGRTGYRTAKLLQTALAVDLLLYAPVRIGNLASTVIDRHIIVVRTMPRVVHLRFSATEVKNRQDLEFPLPPETVELLDLYLGKFRPLLSNKPSPFLFPGKTAEKPKVVGALRQQISNTVYKYTALEMPPHRFRHAVGKIFLDRNPGQYGVVQRLLGHKRIETTIAFYAGEEGAAAARHYHETILGLRTEARRTQAHG